MVIVTSRPPHRPKEPANLIRRRVPSLSHAFSRVAPRTLWARFALTSLAVVVLVMGALAVYLAFITRDLYLDRLERQLQADAQLVSELVAPSMSGAEVISRVDPIAKRIGLTIQARVTIIDAHGVVVGESERDPRGMENHGSRPEVVQARDAGVGEQQRHSATIASHFLYLAVPMRGVPDAVVRLAVPLDEVDQAVRRIQRDIAVATLLATGLVVVAALTVASRISRPLDDLQRQATAVAAGRFDTIVEPATTQELGDLGRAFNTMTRQLRSSAEEIERSRVRLEVTLASLTDGVVITDNDERVMRLNRAAAGMMGARSATAVGHPLIEVARDHDLSALLDAALTDPPGTKPRQATIELGRTRRVIDATAQRVTGAGEPLGLVVLRDVTEMRRLESVRREFVANVSHELRTPLTSIKALVETLEAGAADDPEVSTDFFRRIVGEVDRLATLVDELLDLARLESGRLVLHREFLPPARVIADTVERLASQLARARLQLNLEVSDGLPLMPMDQARIEQVLLNLIHNAIKFTPPGGVITVRAELNEDWLRIDVQDTGVGVAADDLPRLFERFYKTDRARHTVGTGLGLAIAKHIVQAHGGEIWADSEPGRGAMFSFTVPAAHQVDGVGAVSDID